MEECRNKGGRPKKRIKRTSVTGVRFTAEEYLIVKNKAVAAGLRLTVYMRQIAINGHVIARISETEKAEIKSLIGMSNNINQMTKKAHQEGLLKSAIVFEEMLAELEAILSKMKR